MTMLLTRKRVFFISAHSEPACRGRKSLWHLITPCLVRWCIEETIRFLKQVYQLEGTRILTRHRLQHITALAHFALVHLGLRLKLPFPIRRLFKPARRVFGIPDLRLYALEIDMHHLLCRRTWGNKEFLALQKPSFVQRILFDH